LKRPEQHETDDKGDAIFRSVFSRWGVNPSEKDYGWDYAVEVFRGGISEGLLFTAQLKSSTATSYSADGTFVSQSLDRDAVEYLARQLKQPTFLFHADVIQKRLFWSSIQLDGAVLQALEDGDTKSLTVRIPTTNLLPERFDRFLDALRRVRIVLLSRGMLATDGTDFVSAIRGQAGSPPEDLAGDLHEKAFRLEMQQAHEIFQTGDSFEAVRRLKAIVTSSTASLTVRFNATVQLGDIEWSILLKSDQPQIAAAEKRLEVACALGAMAKKGPKAFRLYAALARIAGQLYLVAHRQFGLAMNWHAQNTAGHDPLWVACLLLNLNDGFATIARKYRRAIRLVKATAASPYRWISPGPVMDIAQAIGVLAIVLEKTEIQQAAQQYRQTGFQLFRFAAEIAMESGNEAGIFKAVTLGVLIGQGRGGCLEWARSIVERWDEDNEHRKRAEAFIGRLVAEDWGGRSEGRGTQNSVRQAHENVLSGLGINPLAPPWKQLIELAMRDSDPSRVLRHCHHTFLSLGPGGNPILAKVGLEHAGPKTLHCTLHQHVLSGPDLDGIKEAFTKRHCDSCSDLSPRDSNWQFSWEWQDRENARWARSFGVSAIGGSRS